MVLGMFGGWLFLGLLVSETQPSTMPFLFEISMYRCIFVVCYGFSLPWRKAIDQRFFDLSKKGGLAQELKLVDDNGLFGRPIAMDAFPCSLEVL
jgi:hypothetical protein